MVEILLELDPSLSKHVITTRKGKKLMYGDLKKACYGTLLGSLLWFENLTKKMEEWVLEANPYDSCCINKMINK